MNDNSLHEQEQLVQLAKVRRLATGLLLAMAAVFVAAKLLEPRYHWMSFVHAFAEAAMVGALADWFAVTALFKHPLGVPIPHTAIIPKNKDRIGSSIAHFLEYNFITREVITEELRDVDFAAVASQWLSDPANSRELARHIVSAVPALLRMMEDEDIGAFLQQRASSALKNVNFGPLLGEVLLILESGGQLRVIFDHLIDIVARTLEKNRPYIRQKIHERSPKWIPKTIDEKFYERLVLELENILDEMRQPESEWRDRFDEAAQRLIDNLKTSPEYQEKIASAVHGGLSNPLFKDYLTRIWHDVRGRVLADAASEDSRAVARLNQAVHAFAQALAQDEAVSGKLNHWIREFAAETVVARRNTIAGLVQRVIWKWDADTVAHKVEIHVGKDLQYIRINGTLVGGMVGLAIHTLSLAF